ncbi:hypothetical protein K9M74_00235 [Candidatus Woesearchaeota archaeon]|nr:hypothetical protein [Candidatus Woesearchaeota archaeon]
MDFKQQKKQTLEKLYKPDQSKKGTVDKRLEELINLVNEHPDYYTTSSCSGRISLFTDHNSLNKADAEWLFVTHEQADVKEILQQLQQELPASTLWLRQEGFIFHVCAKNLPTANKLMQFAQANGFKKTTILGASKRFIVEILSTQRIDAPLAQEGKLLVTEKYIQFLTSLANEKLAKTHEQINRLKNAWINEFS